MAPDEDENSELTKTAMVKSEQDLETNYVICHHITRVSANTVIGQTYYPEEHKTKMSDKLSNAILLITLLFFSYHSSHGSF